MTSIKLINLAIPHTFRHPKEWTIEFANTGQISRPLSPPFRVDVIGIYVIDIYVIDMWPLTQ